MANNEKNDDVKFYGMKNDYMFKAVLQKSEHVLKNLVSVLLDLDEVDIKSCIILNSIELGKNDERFGIDMQWRGGFSKYG